jgi:hypothetical protein
MKAGAIVAIVIGAVVVIFLAVNRGLISSGVSVGVGPGGVTTGKGIVAPQPSQNYGGYLAASTAPGVSSALNGALMGLGGAFASWMHETTPPGTTPIRQGASPTSPSLGAQPIGVTTSDAPIGGSLVGPQPATLSNLQLTYDAGTSGAAFDYAGLAGDNSWDSAASLDY